jgi:hypothetical protein
MMPRKYRKSICLCQLNQAERGIIFLSAGLSPASFSSDRIRQSACKIYENSTVDRKFRKNISVGEMKGLKTDRDLALLRILLANGA